MFCQPCFSKFGVFTFWWKTCRVLLLPLHCNTIQLAHSGLIFWCFGKSNNARCRQKTLHFHFADSKANSYGNTICPPSFIAAFKLLNLQMPDTAHLPPQTQEVKNITWPEYGKSLSTYIHQSKCAFFMQPLFFLISIPRCFQAWEIFC